MPQPDEAGYELRLGTFVFTMDDPAERQRALAFARLLGHLLDDGSISVLGQGCIHVGQAVDRETVLADVELVTGKRPAGTRYDERKWSVILPKELTAGIMSLPGIRVGRRTPVCLYDALGHHVPNPVPRSRPARPQQRPIHR